MTNILFIKYFQDFLLPGAIPSGGAVIRASLNPLGTDNPSDYISFGREHCPMHPTLGQPGVGIQPPLD